MHIDQDDTSDSVEIEDVMEDGLNPKLDAMAVVTEEKMTAPSYRVVPHPKAEAADLSELRGVKQKGNNANDNDGEQDLDNLAELVPDIKARRPTGDTTGAGEFEVTSSPKVLEEHGEDGAMEIVEATSPKSPKAKASAAKARKVSTQNDNLVHHTESMQVQGSTDNYAMAPGKRGATGDESHNIGDSTSFDEDYNNGSDQALDDDDLAKMPKEFVNHGASSAQSISTATQTHEVVRILVLCLFVPHNTE